MIPHLLARAALDGNIECLKEWLASGERDVNEDVEGHPAGASGTLLHFSLSGPRQQARSHLVKLLLDHGADVTARFDHDNISGTALHLCRFPEEVALLLDHGADIEAQASNKLRPLHAAINNFTQLHLLVRRGADIFVKNRNGRDAEAIARSIARGTDPYSLEHNSDLLRSADFLAAVKLDGGWQKYLRAPRIELVRLRSLCDRGRAAPCSTVTFANLEACHALTSAEIEIFERMFGPSATKSPRGPSNRLPNEIFWNILAFWRSSRDELPPIPP